jgi:A/G-specific adenine glycosylase
MKVRNRYFNYLVIADANANRTTIQKELQEVFSTLYKFPLVKLRRGDFDFISAKITTDFLRVEDV